MADEWGDGFADTLDPEPAEVVVFTRARLEDEFQHWIRGNYRDEDDREFREYLELEYPWLFITPADYDCPEDEQWLRNEHNLYVNSIYDTRRRI